MMPVATMVRPCADDTDLIDGLILEIARLTGVNEDDVRIAHGMPIGGAR